MNNEETGTDLIKSAEAEHDSLNKSSTEEEVSRRDFNPVTNHNAIVIEKQKDGNYKGFMWKNGKLIQTRQVDPGNVMQYLITHE